MPMLLNLSNHPSTKWPANQFEAAIQQYGSIQDLPFPAVDPAMDSTALDELVEEYEHQLRRIDPKVIHLMGELTFTFRLVTRLKLIGYSVIASTTERQVTTNPEGVKTSLFRFVRFRNY